MKNPSKILIIVLTIIIAINTFFLFKQNREINSNIKTELNKALDFVKKENDTIKKRIIVQKSIIKTANDSIVVLDKDKEYWRARYYRRNIELEKIKAKYAEINNIDSLSTDSLHRIITNHRYNPFK